MADSKKRKERGGNNSNNDQRGPKRSKGGSGGKWQTPHQKARFARGNGQIEPGDAGIWATCAKNQESRAAEELLGMLEECAQRFYGITDGLGDDEDEDENSVDIEKSIQKELSKQKSAPKLFRHVHLDIPCVMFFKTRSPIDPVDFVRRIVREVVENPDIRRMRYINRLTPTTLIGKATEKSLDDMLQTVLLDHFQLVKPENASEAKVEVGDGSGAKTKTELATESKEATKSISGLPSYAIRPSIRAHNNLKRDAVIKQIASSIADEHSVDLTSPDKVILVEIYTAICGISVVGSDWEAYKRYNLAELYPKTPKSASSTSTTIPETSAQA